VIAQGYGAIIVGNAYSAAIFGFKYKSANRLRGGSELQEAEHRGSGGMAGRAGQPAERRD
jgi:hypothetical protein